VPKPAWLRRQAQKHLHQQRLSAVAVCLRNGPDQLALAHRLNRVSKHELVYERLLRLRFLS